MSKTRCRGIFIISVLVTVEKWFERYFYVLREHTKKFGSKSPCIEVFIAFVKLEVKRKLSLTSFVLEGQKCNFTYVKVQKIFYSDY